ncbi:hypothetical protein H0194_08030 [Corynebacterium incognita]|uniref:Uncharacterized protein n=1 Tax=Corynebacterium incognita TaxID=2754725 RepID=A0A7G7CN58_9CORY|nr:hypothetical protein [Corynebacterium incognita]QNE89024.1 hypothetical protein H0194_08030 [Corynebacterium incognita]
MARALIDFVLGAVILALGIWWFSIVGPSVQSVPATIVMGIGGALIVAGWSNALDVYSPTSKKL